MDDRQDMRQDLGAISGSRERSQSALSRPIGFDQGALVPLAMGPELSAAATERLRKMEQLDLQALISACKFPVGSPVTFHDEEGAHDPCYVVLPGGAMLAINHWSDELTDVARAIFIVRACNAALAIADGSPDRRDVSWQTEAALVREITFQTAQLRHAYTQLAAENVIEQRQFADGLISPAIRLLEGMLAEYAAQAIEARRAETENTGSVGDESPVRKDAPPKHPTLIGEFRMTAINPDDVIAGLERAIAYIRISQAHWEPLTVAEQLERLAVDDPDADVLLAAAASLRGRFA